MSSKPRPTIMSLCEAIPVLYEHPLLGLADSPGGLNQPCSKFRKSASLAIEVVGYRVRQVDSSTTQEQEDGLGGQRKVR